MPVAGTAENPRLLLATPEVAVALGVSERLIKKFIQAGALPSVKVGRLRQVAVDDLHAWIERQRAAGQPIGPEAHR